MRAKIFYQHFVEAPSLGVRDASMMWTRDPVAAARLALVEEQIGILYKRYQGRLLQSLGARKIQRRG